MAVIQSELMSINDLVTAIMCLNKNFSAHAQSCVWAAILSKHSLPSPQASVRPPISALPPSSFTYTQRIKEKGWGGLSGMGERGDKSMALEQKGRFTGKVWSESTVTDE